MTKVWEFTKQLRRLQLHQNVSLRAIVNPYRTQERTIKLRRHVPTAQVSSGVLV